MKITKNLQPQKRIVEVKKNLRKFLKCDACNIERWGRIDSNVLPKSGETTVFTCTEQGHKTPKIMAANGKLVTYIPQAD